MLELLLLLHVGLGLERELLLGLGLERMRL
jgi:hypothetical protein